VNPKPPEPWTVARSRWLTLTFTRTQITKIEAGTRPVFDYELVAIAKSLKVPLTLLFTW
jgi:hypothetical protein